MTNDEKKTARWGDGGNFRVKLCHSGFFRHSSFVLRHFHFCPLLLCLASLALPARAEPQTASPPKTAMAEKLKPCRFKHNLALEMNYLLYLPQDYAAGTGRRWPLLLFLHGAGERGSDVWKVATHGPTKNVNEHPDFPFIVVSPQCCEGAIWSSEALLALLKDVAKEYPVDAGRIYLTGLSMGGFGTWDLGLAHPEIFAAIVPICGGGESISLLLSSRDKPQALKTLGVWAFHGAKDPVVPMAESQRMVDMLKKLNLQDLTLTVYPEAEHDAWTQTYKNPDLYKWLLKHERKPAPNLD
jgi:predicted peptidase